jgi:hypothetical protein
MPARLAACNDRIVVRVGGGWAPRCTACAISAERSSEDLFAVPQLLSADGAKHGLGRLPLPCFPPPFALLGCSAKGRVSAPGLGVRACGADRVAASQALKNVSRGAVRRIPGTSRRPSQHRPSSPAPRRSPEHFRTSGAEVAAMEVGRGRPPAPRWGEEVHRQRLHTERHRRRPLARDSFEREPLTP